MCAYQINKKPPGAKILRTPAPKIEAKTGGEGYGEANYSGPSSLPMADLSQGTSKLAQNLLQSGHDDGQGVLEKVISGVLRADNAGPVSDEKRTIKADAYPTSFGHKRQQADLASIGRADLPKSTKVGPDDSDQRRAMAVKRTQ